MHTKANDTSHLCAEFQSSLTRSRGDITLIVRFSMRCAYVSPVFTLVARERLKLECSGLSHKKAHLLFCMSTNFIYHRTSDIQTGADFVRQCGEDF